MRGSASEGDAIWEEAAMLPPKSRSLSSANPSRAMQPTSATQGQELRSCITHPSMNHHQSIDFD